ncbi:MAG TPA: cupredoxin domain-containing protein [Actinomycetota bacterium]|nr:cupredoxin domain-containing protein [Actinomycetota bacterium]
MRRLAALLLLVVAVLALPAVAAGQGPTVIETQDNKFVPETETVQVGDQVTFRNTGKAPHNVQADDGSFKIDIINPGESKSITASKAGSFSYVCSFHPPDMKGTLTVEAGAGSEAPATGTTSPTPVSDVQDDQAPPVGPAVPGEETPSPEAPNPLAISPLPVVPTEKYFPIGAVALGGLLLLFAGMLYIKMVVMKSASRRT